MVTRALIEHCHIALYWLYPSVTMDNYSTCPPLTAAINPAPVHISSCCNWAVAHAMPENNSPAAVERQAKEKILGRIARMEHTTNCRGHSGLRTRPLTVPCS